MSDEAFDNQEQVNKAIQASQWPVKSLHTYVRAWSPLEDRSPIRCKNCGIVVREDGDYLAPRHYPEDCPRFGCEGKEGYA